MLIRFADGTDLEVRTIMGGPRFIQNANRDVLTIQVDPDKATLAELQEIFKDKKKTVNITSVNTEEVSVGTGEDATTETKEVVKNIGEQYTLYLSCGNKIEEKRPEPGTVSELEFDEYNEVEIAQLTHTEVLLEQLLGSR